MTRRLALALTALLAGCYAPEHEGDHVHAPLYVLTNLHPDDRQGELWSLNYQRDGLIRACTEVEIVDEWDDSITFVVVATGREYVYRHHERAGESFEANLDRSFGDACDKDEPARLSAVDQEGIRKGEALVGMSRRGVVLAIGYPPPRATSDTERDEWLYWRNRFNRFVVEFGADGKVARVRN